MPSAIVHLPVCDSADGDQVFIHLVKEVCLCTWIIAINHVLFFVCVLSVLINLRPGFEEIRLSVADPFPELTVWHLSSPTHFSKMIFLPTMD